MAAHLTLKHLSDGINHCVISLVLTVFPSVLVRYKSPEHLHDVLFLRPLDGKNHPLKNVIILPVNLMKAQQYRPATPCLREHIQKNRWFHCHPLYAQTFRFPHLHPATLHNLPQWIFSHGASSQNGKLLLINLYPCPFHPELKAAHQTLQNVVHFRPHFSWKDFEWQSKRTDLVD